jgi:23S rRNA (uracil1939-C5)-methyltransferase
MQSRVTPVPAPPPVASDARVSCEHAETCGGCPLIGLAYGEQLGMKRGRLVQSVSRYPSLELVYTEPVLPAEPVSGYRTRAKLIAGAGGRLGLYAKGGGHHLVDIPGCRVLSPVLTRMAEALRARIYADETNGGPLAPVDGTSHAGALRAVDLREIRSNEAGSALAAEARVLVTLVVQRNRAGDLSTLRAAAQSLLDTFPEVMGVAANLHDGEAPQILGSETQHLAGASAARDRLGGSVHLATFGSFVQAHRGQAERVHGALLEQIRGAAASTTAANGVAAAPRVLDLYGGSGAIALSLAAAWATVHLVESFAPAVAHAEAAAREQKLPLTAECGDVATALRSILERGDRFDAVVVNPPRRGMSAIAREWVARLEAPVIAYVSCDPDTLARDLDHFTRLGYTTSLLRPLDMIPLTDEVETVAILRRIPLAPPKVIYEDAEVLFVDKGPHEPTSRMDGRAGDHGSSLMDRLHGLPGAENAVPVHRIDIGTSGLVVLVRDPSRVAAWQDAFTSASTRKIYVAAARGVTPAKGAITRELREDGQLYTARTRYRRLAVASGHSVLRVIPEQGRTHQIRRHLSAIGHPVLGDDRYGHPPTNRFFEEKNGLDRPFLHCVRIEMEHPTTGARLTVEAPLPGDLRAVLERTSGPGTLRFLDHKNALGTSGLSTIPPPPDSMMSNASLGSLEVDVSAVNLHIVDPDDKGWT